MNGTASGTALRRRHEIQRLVREVPVRSQQDLQRLLRRRGFTVAQPTLSRDLRELGLAKTAAGYALPAEAAPSPEKAAAARTERLERALVEYALVVRTAASLVVLRTPPAAAHPLARALDEADLEGVMGTIAGDDTIFLATRSAAEAESLARRLLRPLASAGGRTTEDRRRARRPRA
jgi:transcriptional regulator of arginine metabolism